MEKEAVTKQLRATQDQLEEALHEILQVYVRCMSSVVAEKTRQQPHACCATNGIAPSHEQRTTAM